MQSGYLSVPPVSVDQVVSDFDGVTFHLSTPEAKTKILISINVRCYRELVQYGAQEVLEREYGPYIVVPESGYDFSIQIDLEDLPADAGGFAENRKREKGRLAEIRFRRSKRRSGPTSVVAETKRRGRAFRTGIRRFPASAGGSVQVHAGIGARGRPRRRGSDGDTLPGRRSHLHQS